MTYIIAEPCIDIKDLSCVDVCPVDCIHEFETHPDHRPRGVHRLLDQHSLVNEALADPLADGTVHELRIKTRGAV
jgi:hypothetical protein